MTEDLAGQAAQRQRQRGLLNLGAASVVAEQARLVLQLSERDRAGDGERAIPTAPRSGTSLAPSLCPGCDTQLGIDDEDAASDAGANGAGLAGGEVHRERRIRSPRPDQQARPRP